MDTDSISKWVNCNNLTLNPTKCKLMVISWKQISVKPHACFTLNSSPLEQVETFKYLGIFLSSDLSWSSHIGFICTKARKLIGLLYRRFYGNVDNHSLLELYSVFVRPHLEYAAPIWDPHFIKDTNKLESVQRFALKMFKNNGTYLLDLSQLPTLENHGLYLKLCTLYKTIYGNFYFPSNVFVPHVNRHSYSLPLIHQLCAHTNAFQSGILCT